MASSIAHPINFADQNIVKELKIHIPKPTAIDKIGGIYCHICNNTFKNKKEFDSHYTQHNTGGGDIVYTCVACKKQIPNYPSFRGHCYLNHVVKNKFQCKHCDKSFCKLSILNGHIAAIHNFKCGSCDEKFDTKKELDTHNNIHFKTRKGGVKNAPPYNCSLCKKSIETLDMCEEHIDELCEIQYPCSVCNEINSSKTEAAKHLTKHFAERSTSDVVLTTECAKEDSSIHILGGVLCCHCDSIFRNRSEIDSHFVVEHDDKPIAYTCNICSKSYDKYEKFGKHCYLHIAKDRFQCEECYKTFPRLSLLVIHTEAFHMGGSDKPFACTQCSHSFMTHNRLQEHLRIVHEEMAIPCLKIGCPATFEKPRDLIQHQKEHCSYLDNWCRQCGLQLVSLTSAERHLDVHRRKQYSCPVCGKEYRERYLMMKHVPSHFEAVLHVCKMCGKTYVARNRFIQHLKTHSELRGFKCSYCGKGFNRPHELKQHVNVHTGRRPFRCPECSRTFANHPNWSKHLARVHRLDKLAIRRLKEAHDLQPAPPSSHESGIESGGSDLSLDPATVAESADVKPRADWTDALDLGDDLIADTVDAAILCLNEDLALTTDRLDLTELDPKSEYARTAMLDDASDIKAIVEDIDAMSGAMEGDVEQVAAAPAAGDSLQYADLMPVDHLIFNTIPDTIQQTEVPEASYYHPSACQPEYGPDFISEGAGLACEGLIDLNDHLLPHIDPLLTIKAQENAKMYVQNLDNFNFDNLTASDSETQNPWPPLITKVFYEENTDMNRMYIY